MPRQSAKNRAVKERDFAAFLTQCCDEGEGLETKLEDIARAYLIWSRRTDSVYLDSNMIRYMLLGQAGFEYVTRPQDETMQKRRRTWIRRLGLKQPLPPKEHPYIRHVPAPVYTPAPGAHRVNPMKLPAGKDPTETARYLIRRWTLTLKSKDLEMLAPTQRHFVFSIRYRYLESQQYPEKKFTCTEKQAAWLWRVLQMAWPEQEIGLP